MTMMRSRHAIVQSLMVVLGSAGVVQAESALLGKTVDVSFRICATTTRQCTKSTHTHIYIGKSGQIYSFNGKSTGASFVPGQVSRNGNSANRFRLEGDDKLIFEAITRNGSQGVGIRLGIQVHGDRCAFSDFLANSTSGGLPLKVEYGACRVYQGRQSY